MPENSCPSEIQLSHTATLATMKTEIDNIKTTVSDFSQIKTAIIKLTILSEQQLQFNERQLQANDKFEATLTSINENLNTLNIRVGNLENEKIEEVETEKEIKVEKIKLIGQTYQSKFVFYGILATGILALLGIVIPLVVK